MSRFAYDNLRRAPRAQDVDADAIEERLRFDPAEGSTGFWGRM
jgi:hypothetical protein